jgi:peptidoglycan/xylan/chitin deacetylase (PgdA/CDA1 family)
MRARMPIHAKTRAVTSCQHDGMSTLRAALPILLSAILSMGSGCNGGGTGGGAGGGGNGGNGSGGNGSGGNGSGGMSVLPVPPGDATVPRPSGMPQNLTVLNWAGFAAAVTYTFDDTNSSQIAHYAELQALGVRMTFYLITGKTEISDPTWVQALNDGHELGNHTKSHLAAGTAADVDAATDVLQQRFGITAWTMAAPYGDPSYPPLAATRFLVNRGVVDGLMGAGDNTDPFNLFCYVPPQGASASAFDAEIDAARSAGKWRVVLVHGFTGGADGAYQPVSITEFTSSVNHTQSFGDVWIDSMVNVAAYWRGQKLFSAATITPAGASTTWTWTLPAHFPPGHSLRVTMDGGTLTQGGAPLAWDAHGYYEISLDAGSLTLSP